MARLTLPPEEKLTSEQRGRLRGGRLPACAAGCPRR
jgi:hypothetical protein